MGRKPNTEGSTATIGFEAKFWLTADRLRNNMDAAEYKHIVLGLSFLTHNSDTWEWLRAKQLSISKTVGDYQAHAESRSGSFRQITVDSISQLPMVMPPIAIHETYQGAVGKFYARIKVNKQKARTLATVRNTLLPKLLRGELSVEKPENN